MCKNMCGCVVDGDTDDNASHCIIAYYHNFIRCSICTYVPVLPDPDTMQMCWFAVYFTYM